MDTMRMCEKSHPGLNPNYPNDTWLQRYRNLSRIPGEGRWDSTSATRIYPMLKGPVKDLPSVGLGFIDPNFLSLD